MLLEGNNSSELERNVIRTKAVLVLISYFAFRSHDSGSLLESGFRSTARNRFKSLDLACGIGNLSILSTKMEQIVKFQNQN